MGGMAADRGAGPVRATEKAALNARGGWLFRSMLHGCSELLVLATLREGALHGYGMRKALYARTGGYVRLSFGNLYPLLARMERRGLVRSRLAAAGPARQVRVYRLTAAGTEAMALQQAAWTRFARHIGKALRPAAGGG